MKRCGLYKYRLAVLSEAQVISRNVTSNSSCIPSSDALLHMMNIIVTHMERGKRFAIVLLTTH